MGVRSIRHRKTPPVVIRSPIGSAGGGNAPPGCPELVSVQGAATGSVKVGDGMSLVMRGSELHLRVGRLSARIINLGDSEAVRQCIADGARYLGQVSKLGDGFFEGDLSLR